MDEIEATTWKTIMVKVAVPLDGAQEWERLLVNFIGGISALGWEQHVWGQLENPADAADRYFEQVKAKLEGGGCGQA